jgi:hypothetical protein
VNPLIVNPWGAGFYNPMTGHVSGADVSGDFRERLWRKSQHAEQRQSSNHKGLVSQNISPHASILIFAFFLRGSI